MGLTPSGSQAAQTVVRQFDLVALLIEGRMFDPNLFLRSWQHDIVLCWQACEAQVQRQACGLTLSSLVNVCCP